MKKGFSFVWNSTCQEAFEEIKRYLTHPPILAAPVLGKSFIIYVRVMDHCLDALLAKNNDQGHEQAICYLSSHDRTRSSLQSSRKRVSSFGFRRPEDATQSYRPDYSCHLKS